MSTQPTPVDEADLRTRLATLTLEQKVELLTGRDFWALNDAPAAGLRRMVLSDGPAGVRGERWDERSPSANVPTPTALAATWDEERVGRIGHLLAGESRAKGVDVLLAPTVNLHRSPYGGRHFECLSEDPFLTGRIGTAYVQGVQSGGVAATVKHFVGNDSETDRFTVDARIDERTLRELYLAPFETIVADGVWAVMSAYNQVNGTTMTESALQRDVLKGEWGFDGVAMSDWYAARTLAAAGEELLDLVMPGPNGPWGAALVAAVEDGSIPESSVDDKVLRLLRLAARVGALSGVAAAVPAVTPWTHEQIAAELRSAAAAGFVLARNEGDVLPLADDVRTVAVIGPNAATGRTLGGGSATVFPYYTVSPLDGIVAAAGDRLTVTYSEGVRSSDRLAPATADQLLLPDGSGPGAEVRFLDAEGVELARENRLGAAYTWLGLVTDDLAVPDVAAVEVTTRLVVAESGSYLVGAAGVGTVPPHRRWRRHRRRAGRAARGSRRGRGDDDAAAARDVDRPHGRRAGRRTSPLHASDVRRLRRRHGDPDLPAVRAGRDRRGRRVRARRDPRRRGRRGRRRRRHHRRGGERGLRPYVAGAPRPPGRARPPGRGRQPAHRRRREQRRTGPAALGRRGRRHPARLVPGPGVRQRARRRAARHRRARRSPPHHLADHRRRPPVGDAHRRHGHLRRGPVHRLPALRPGRARAAVPLRPRPRLHDVRLRGGRGRAHRRRAPWWP